MFKTDDSEIVITKTILLIKYSDTVHEDLPTQWRLYYVV